MKKKNAFTLIELLVVIAIIAILAALLLPTLSRAKQQSQGIKCLSNMKQLTLAWTLYANDYNDLLVTNTVWDNTNSWAAGFLDWSDSTAPGNTNTLDLMSPRGLLWPFSQSLDIYKCPADPARVDIDGVNYPLVRSISMNERMNGGEWPTASIAEFNNPNKLSAIVNPGPATAFVFVDERADSINDGFFVVDMIDTNASATLGNIPANYHNGCSAISFADAHAEIHKWLDARTEPPLDPYVMQGGGPMPNNPDVTWIQQHCSAHQ